MNTLWTYFWPILCVGLLAGGLGGLFGFRRKRRRPLIIAGLVALAAAAAWHGPLGAADRFTTKIERQARQALDYYEMTKVTAHLHRGPLSRRLILSGPADDFQTSELARLLGQLPGVSSVSWSDRTGGIPLIAEGELAAILGFLGGLLIAYLIELRRRYNAQWTW
ncbi:MAG TPA: hypothetical protein VN640_05090 [Sphingomicrobium sp.]|jgi:hypothetical protein|nr:hypothetical protein [Sphingomicrobium sp.]